MLIEKDTIKCESIFNDERTHRYFCKRVWDKTKPLLNPCHADNIMNDSTTTYVGVDYLVSDGRNKYSVPFDLIGEKVDIRLTSQTVEVFFHGSRVASHVRLAVSVRDPIINPDHMTPEHRKYLSYNKEDFSTWAISIGANTEKVVSYFLSAGKEAEQGFKACSSLTKLEERYGKKKLEEACGEVLRYTMAPSIRLISTVLKSTPIKIEEPAPVLNHSNAHGITRGAAYYSRSTKNGKDGDSK